MAQSKHILAALLAIGLLASWSLPCFAEGDVKKGKRKYNEFCAQCHGKEGKGDGTRVMVEKFDPKPRNHTDGKYMNSRTDVQLFKVVKEGGKANNFSHIMPQWKHILNDQDVWNLVAYIRSLAVPAWTGTPTPPPPPEQQPK